MKGFELRVISELTFPMYIYYSLCQGRYELGLENPIILIKISKQKN